MLEFQTENIRNIALIGHGDAGKTSMVEGFLFSTKEINRLGTVDDGTTVSDYNSDEIDRKFSISTSLMHCVRESTKINILDTPGYIDFTGEVKSGLHPVEISALVVSSVAGIEVGTELVWGYTQKSKKPSLVILNKLDKDNSKFQDILLNLRNTLTTKVFPVQFPANEGAVFDSIVDVIDMKLHKYTGDKSGNYKKEDIPADLSGKAEELRNELKEIVAESDDDLLEKYLEEGDLTEDEFKNGLRKAIIDCNIFPLLCSSAELNVGPASILDFIIDYCPDPSMVGDIKATNPKAKEEQPVKVSADGPVSFQVFKTISEPHVGELSFFKCYSGAVKPGLELINNDNSVKERLGQIYSMNGHDRKEIARVEAGDIGAIVKLKDTHTGNTLSASNNPLEFRQIEFPNPVIRMAVKPKSKGDEEKLMSGLNKLHEEDPSFFVTVDTELHQTILSGQGEMHLEIVIKRLKNKLGVEVETEDPKVPFRETIRKTVKVQGKYKKQSGGRGQYGDTWIELSPKSRGDGFEFVDNIVGGVIPSKYIPAVEKGIKETMETGIVSGCPIVDVRVSLYDGSFHNVDSSDMAFKIAGSMAFKKAFVEANPILLEPIYEVEVIVPEDYMGDVMGDLSSRRGRILGTDSEGAFQVIKAHVPLMELYKYSTSLRSITSGRGLHRRKFSSYEEMPGDIKDKVIKEFEESKQQD